MPSLPLLYPIYLKALTHSRWLQGLQVDDVTLVEGQ